MRRAVLATILAFVVCATPASALTITWSAFGTSLTPGWYVSDVWVNWTLSNVAPPLQQGCDPVHFVNDTTGQTATCRATDANGTTTQTTTPIRIDRAPPSVTARGDRPPDAGGFYNHPFTATWAGTDATSGIASCTSMPYGGPDGTSISLTGTCTDKAGNVSAPVPFVFNYDATPPGLTGLRARPDDRGAKLSWQAPGAARIVVARNGAVVYDGGGAGFIDKGLKNGGRYTYLVQAFDAAGNVASGSATVRPNAAASSEHLLSPGFQSKLSRAPMLRWREVRRASYYNVQLFRKGKKILSAWPTKPHYQLRRAWRYRGKRHRLLPGTYWWYLWGGYGHRSEHRYGKLLGRRSFTIT